MMRQSLMYAGVDPSITNTGLVLLDENGKLQRQINGKDSGHNSLKFTSATARYRHQAEYLAKQIEDVEIVAIAWEGYSYGSVHLGYSLAECGGVLKSIILHDRDLPILEVPPTTLKKFATGWGLATKKEMIAKAISECSSFSQKTTSDVCDAFFLAKYAFYLNNPDKAALLDKGKENLRMRLEMIQNILKEGKTHEA